MTVLSGLSLRTRLLAGSLIWIALALLVTGVVLTTLFRAHVERRFDAELATHLNQLLANLQPDDKGGLTLAHPMTDPRFERPYSALYWQVDGPGGTMLRSRSLWDRTLPLPRDTPANGQMHRHLVPGPDGQHLVAVERKVSLPGLRGVVRAAVAGDLDVVNRATAAFVRMTVLTLGTLAAGLLLAVMAQAVGTLRPLGRMQAALAAVRLGRAARLEGQYPAEIQPLVDDLNGLLAHNVAVLERARTEAGNLAHQLKTPLAIIINAAASLPADETAAMVLEQATLMSRRIDYALTRARAAASGRVLGATTAVGPQLARMAGAMRTLYAGRGLRIDVPESSRAVVQVEPQDFDEIVGNLLDNACKWARARVAVSVAEEASATRIVVEDDGPGLPEAERQRVFARGHKLDEAAPGSGLGLSIVQDITAAYDGGIRLETSALGGLRAIVSLPRARAALRPAQSARQGAMSGRHGS
ncbi:MAG: ATP-binding protein [Rhodospirillales bacterium]|nr:ATP-binding protein [Rhodospirillales bacterium]